MMTQNIFILGATGQVGQELVKQVYNKTGISYKKHSNPTKIIGLASSSGYIFNQKGLSSEISKGFSKKEFLTPNYRNMKELLEGVQLQYKGPKRNLVFVDVTAAKNDMADFHTRVIDTTDFKIVTANKNPISLFDNEVFNRLALQTHRYGYSCSVMAGSGAVPFLQDLRDVDDLPTLIQGCFSGTLGYLCNELENNVSLYDSVTTAKKKGYTEPHPKDDLNGLDVARKLLILTRTIGHNVDLSDIKIESFIPEKYMQIKNIDEFLDSLKDLNGSFSDKFSQAKLNGNTLRYVASMKVVRQKPKLEVKLCEVPKNSSLGALRGTANKAVIVNDAYTIENPYGLESPGAGLKVTAQNIRRNLLHLLDYRKSF